MTITPALPSPAPRSTVVDAWRVLACLGVVLFHACQTVHDPHPLLERIAGVFGQDGPRMAIFFVISGFCIARSIEHRAAAGDGVVAFWGQRLLRIFPVYWAALLTAILLALIALPLNGLPVSSALPVGSAAWLADLSLTNLWVGIKPRLLVSWTLNYEIGFYILVGATLCLPGRTARLFAYGTLTALSHLPAAKTWFPLLEIWPQFACGLAAWLAVSPTTPSSVRRLALAYPLLLALISLFTANLHAFYAPGVALLLVPSLALEHRLPRPAGWFRLLVSATFSIYLMHVPFMSPALNLAHRLLLEDSFRFVVAWLGILLLGVGAGLLFHCFVERPLIRALKRHLPHPSASKNRPVGSAGETFSSPIGISA